MQKTNKTNQRVFVLLVLMLTLVTVQVFAVDPPGVTIVSNTTEEGPSRAAGTNAANRSTITTMVLSSIQQDQFWKAYVGNVSGSLTLDDPDNNTVYDWSLATPSGEVYATRATLDFSTVACGNITNMVTDNTFHNMTAGQIDNVNGTFNATAHQAFITAGTSFPADNCSSTALYVSDAYVAPSSSAAFQELVLQDNNGALVFTALINDDTNGFDDNDYDFQMIVPESNVKASATTYYFYLELG